MAQPTPPKHNEETQVVLGSPFSHTAPHMRPAPRPCQVYVPPHDFSKSPAPHPASCRPLGSGSYPFSPRLTQYFASTFPLPKASQSSVLTARVTSQKGKFYSPYWNSPVTPHHCQNKGKFLSLTNRRSFTSWFNSLLPTPHSSYTQ